MKLKFGILFVILAGILGSCRQSDEKRVLTVSIEPQRFLLEKIVGDKWQVNTLLGNGADPENFDPTMSAMAKTLDSEAFFKIGNMPFEDKIIERVSGSGKDVRIVDSSRGIQFIEGTHGAEMEEAEADGHVHALDPHVWSSAKNAIVIGENMLEAMVEIDPDNAQYYKDNFHNLKAELQSLDSELASILKGGSSNVFMMWHPSLSYFARDYGLEQIALGAEHKELSAAELKEKIDRARVHDVTVFLVQPEYDMKRSSEVASQAGTTAVTVNLLTYDWADQLMKAANAIAGNIKE